MELLWRIIFAGGEREERVPRQKVQSQSSFAKIGLAPTTEIFQSFRRRPHNSQPAHCESALTNLLRTMISRSAIGGNAQLALRRQCCVKPANRRGLAAAVSGSTSFSYDTADVGGVKVASRDVTGPTTKLAVVAKAGTRYQSAPGLTTGLEQFAFKVGIYSQFPA